MPDETELDDGGGPNELELDRDEDDELDEDTTDGKSSGQALAAAMFSPLDESELDDGSGLGSNRDELDRDEELDFDEDELMDELDIVIVPFEGIPPDAFSA